MKSSRRRIARRSFLAAVTGAGALALGGCSDPGDPAGTETGAGNESQPATVDQDRVQDQG